ncbi:TIGR01906 family membrane protein [Sinomonas sp. ASV322]|nr:TIGR01906 family membrane protein [Sinomonas sp. ASV322]MDQ4503701.1 TIGR01906 family membrane protein [Sinomonas sp. ASV322]
MTEDRHELRPEVNLDESQDTEDPAFEWMRTAAASTSAQASHLAEPSRTAPSAEGDAAPAGEGVSADSAGKGRRAAEATAAETPATAHLEPSPTTALQVRPPEDQVARRAAQRDAAASARPVAPRVFQVLMAIFLPFLLLIAAVRVIATPAFLWLEYFRPGFPGDGYGFSADDRLTYGSYAVDYLSNFAGRRYLGDLVLPSGSSLFTESEVSHMADVKLVILSAYGAGIVLLAFFVVAYLVLRKRRGAFGRGLFAGAIVTFVVVVGLAVLAFLGWQQFFTDFHRIFFSQGNWSFQLSDTLIRLFPSQFWMDSAIAIGVLVLVASSLMIIFAWPMKRRSADGDGAPIQE